MHYRASAGGEINAGFRTRRRIALLRGVWIWLSGAIVRAWRAAREAFRARMYGGDIGFWVSRDFVRACRTPMLVLAGDDLYHPAPIAEEIARLARDAELVTKWKTPDATPAAVARARAFLKAHQ